MPHEKQMLSEMFKSRKVCRTYERSNIYPFLISSNLVKEQNTITSDRRRERDLVYWDSSPTFGAGVSSSFDSLFLSFYARW